MMDLKSVIKSFFQREDEPARVPQEIQQPHLEPFEYGDNNPAEMEVSSSSEGSELESDGEETGYVPIDLPLCSAVNVH